MLSKDCRQTSERCQGQDWSEIGKAGHLVLSWSCAETPAPKVSPSRLQHCCGHHLIISSSPVSSSRLQHHCDLHQGIVVTIISSSWCLHQGFNIIVISTKALTLLWPALSSSTDCLHILAGSRVQVPLQDLANLNSLFPVRLSVS